jgi:hypothetical protein
MRCCKMVVTVGTEVPYLMIGYHLQYYSNLSVYLPCSVLTLFYTGIKLASSSRVRLGEPLCNL